jgi:hypothetical protein
MGLVESHRIILKKTPFSRILSSFVISTYPFFHSDRSRWVWWRTKRRNPFHPRPLKRGENP